MQSTSTINARTVAVQLEHLALAQRLPGSLQRKLPGDERNRAREKTRKWKRSGPTRCRWSVHAMRPMMCRRRQDHLRVQSPVDRRRPRTRFAPVGFRNGLVHEYGRTNLAIVRDLLGNRVRDLREFCGAVRRHSSSAEVETAAKNGTVEKLPQTQPRLHHAKNTSSCRVETVFSKPRLPFSLVPCRSDGRKNRTSLPCRRKDRPASDRLRKCNKLPA